MNYERLSRQIAALLLGVALAFLLNYRVEQRHHMGKEAYLAAEAQHYDRMYTQPGNPLLFGVSAIALAFAVIGLYEGLALVTFKLLKSRKDVEG